MSEASVIAFPIMARVLIAEQNGYVWARFISKEDNKPFYVLCLPASWIEKQGGVIVPRPQITLDSCDLSFGPDYLDDQQEILEVIQQITDPDVQTEIACHCCLTLFGRVAPTTPVEVFQLICGLDAATMAEAYLKALKLI